MAEYNIIVRAHSECYGTRNHDTTVSIHHHHRHPADLHAALSLRGTPGTRVPYFLYVRIVYASRLAEFNDVWNVKKYGAAGRATHHRNQPSTL